MKRSDLQGLRAVAVGIVVAFHAGIPGFTGGYVGVDVFFVISGYLISRHLIEELDASGRIAFGSFYARRVRRIVPAAAVVGVMTLVASVLVLPAVRLTEVARDAISTALFVPNVWFAARGSDYLGAGIPSPFQHYWSLGVEEQFYLVWPILVLLAALASRRRGVTIVLAIVAVGSIALAQWMLSVAPVWAFYSLPTRAGEFAIAGLIAMAAHRWGGAPAAWARVLGWVGLAAIAAATVLFTVDTPFPGLAALIPTVGAAAVIAAGERASTEPFQWGVDRLLGVRPLVVIGGLSYAIYLVHWPLLELPREVIAGGLPVPVSGALALACIPIAWLLQRLVERPILAHPLGAPRRWLALGLAVGLAFSGLGALASLVPTVAPSSAGRSAENAGPRSPTPFVPTDLTPSLANGAADLPDTYGNGCHVPIGVTGVPDCRVGDSGPRVALFGDSHAAQWYPALASLAAQGRIQLVSYTKSACQAWLYATYRDGVADPTCPPWRDRVIADVQADPPDLVIITSSTERATDAARLALWRNSVSPVVAAIVPFTRVVVLEDTPYLDSDPISCLSSHLTTALDCAVPFSAVSNLPVGAIVRDEAERSGATWITIGDLVCPQRQCAAIRGSSLVFRDDNHLSATFSRSLAAALWQRVSAALE